MVAQVYLKKGALVPTHSHESEQMTYVLQGALKFLINGEEITVREGEVLHIPSSIRIRPKRWTTPSSSISSVRFGRTGSITPTPTSIDNILVPIADCRLRLPICRLSVSGSIHDPQSRNQLVSLSA